jgi:hypothetical protein
LGFGAWGSALNEGDLESMAVDLASEDLEVISFQGISAMILW